MFSSNVNETLQCVSHYVIFYIHLYLQCVGVIVQRALNYDTLYTLYVCYSAGRVSGAALQSTTQTLKAGCDAAVHAVGTLQSVTKALCRPCVWRYTEEQDPPHSADRVCGTTLQRCSNSSQDTLIGPLSAKCCPEVSHTLLTGCVAPRCRP